MHAVLLAGVVVSTVDGFQGAEVDIALLSMVRSNNNYNMGFVGCPHRLNVALTRAKLFLRVIGNVDTFQGNHRHFCFARRGKTNRKHTMHDENQGATKRAGSSHASPLCNT